MTMIALLLAATAQAPAQNALTAEEALGAFNTKFKMDADRCRSDEDSEAIVVCGRRNPDNSGPKSLRVPFVRDRGQRVPGEPSFDGGGCIRLCHQPVTIDVRAVPGAVKKVIEYFKRD